jgi:hypothetical protein
MQKPGDQRQRDLIAQLDIPALAKLGKAGGVVRDVDRFDVAAPRYRERNNRGAAG